jgi:[pyruvate, water dikinase]-phosphate phosphotransferase / [pyruvate, water dikinase] kinase
MEDAEPRGAQPHVVLVISDGTGVTGERVVRAALTQFDSDAVVVERIQGVRDEQRIVESIEGAARRDALVLYSLVSPDHRRTLIHEARRNHVFAVDLLGPILRRLSDVLDASPRAKPGLFHQLDEEYFKRIETVDFAIKHDDGRMSHDVGSADLVLVGVSRTSKTPVSMLLAYRGWNVANVPIVLNIDPPEELFTVPRNKVIAVTARPTWLEGVRRERARRLSQELTLDYWELTHIREELAWFRRIVERGGWTVVDVTHKAVEETAAEIVALARET